MTDRPIIFSGPMVRAILDGRKTQTRRVIKDTGLYAIDERWHGKEVATRERANLGKQLYAPGDRLWVRETISKGDWTPPIYRADEEHEYGKAAADHNNIWIPPIFMPRWASRITLTVTNVRVQRVQDISEEDARAEGVECMVMDDDGKFYLSQEGSYRCGFAGLWEHLNAKRGFGWDANPWVVALTFTTERRNIDR